MKAVSLPNEKSGFKKYRFLIISSLGMLLLVIAFVLMELHYSKEISHNLGKYRAYSAFVDTHKHLVIGMQALENERYTPEERIRTAKNLIVSYNQTNELVNAYFIGGTTQVGPIFKRTLNIPIPKPGASEIQYMKKLAHVWNELYKPTLAPIIEQLKTLTANDIRTNTYNFQSLKVETDISIRNWMDGFAIFNKIDASLAKQVKDSENQQYILTAISLAVLFLYFLVIVILNYRRLSTSDTRLARSLKENDNILKTVDSGLFLLDRDLNIGNQHSRALQKILLINDISGKNLSDILQGIVSVKDVETTSEFIEQLYNPRVKEKLINDLNPLKRIAVNLQLGGEDAVRYLDFGFSRIYDEKEISHILVTVNDITESVELAEKLKKESSQNDDQILMITNVLNCDTKIIRDFIDTAKSTTTKINNILKDSGTTGDTLDKKLESIFREAHTLKGETSALDLVALTKRVTDVEETVKLLQKKSNLSGDDFLPLTVRLDEIIEMISTIDVISERLSVANNSVDTSLQSSIISEQRLIESDIVLNNDAVAEVNKNHTVIKEDIEQYSESQDLVDQNLDSQDFIDQPDDIQVEKTQLNIPLFDVVETEAIETESVNNVALNQPLLDSSQPLVASAINTTAKKRVQSVMSQEESKPSQIQNNNTVEEPKAPLQPDNTEFFNFDEKTENSLKQHIQDDPHTSYYINYIKKISERNQKKVHLHIEGAEILNSKSLKNKTMKEIAIQLLRNSVTHGIELPSTRLARSKNEFGNIKFIFKDENNQLSLSVEDDGRGIDYDSIRSKAVVMGKYQEEEAASISNKELLSLMFSQGFTTMKNPNEDAGQGVGLDVVKSKIMELRARLKVDTENGQYTRFTIVCDK